LAEARALHAALLAGCPGRRRWTFTSRALTVTHLGLLGRRRTLGPANAITLLRANLPTVVAPSSRWLGAVALGSDLLDGELARRGHAETLFGDHADSLADAAFWLWFTARHGPSQLLRAALIGAWAAPVVAVTTTAVVRGSMIDLPRPAGSARPPPGRRCSPYAHFVIEGKHPQADARLDPARPGYRRRSRPRLLLPQGAKEDKVFDWWIHSAAASAERRVLISSACWYWAGGSNHVAHGVRER
jgi:CDP-alcohol phosphatidyltransferase